MDVQVAASTPPCIVTRSVLPLPTVVRRTRPTQNNRCRSLGVTRGPNGGSLPSSWPPTVRPGAIARFRSDIVSGLCLCDLASSCAGILPGRRRPTRSRLRQLLHCPMPFPTLSCPPIWPMQRRDRASVVPSTGSPPQARAYAHVTAKVGRLRPAAASARVVTENPALLARAR